MSLPEKPVVLELLLWRNREARPVHIYREPDDWWVGYYRGPNHHYVCPLPTIVIRWARATSSGERAGS